MSKAYWIGHIDIHDPENFPQYSAASSKALAQFGGKFIARGGSAQVVEGSSRTRHVIVEFPSIADAQACYLSDAYAEAKSLRQQWATTDLVIVEGLE